MSAVSGGWRRIRRGTNAGTILCIRTCRAAQIQAVFLRESNRSRSPQPISGAGLVHTSSSFCTCDPQGQDRRENFPVSSTNSHGAEFRVQRRRPARHKRFATSIPWSFERRHCSDRDHPIASSFVPIARWWRGRGEGTGSSGRSRVADERLGGHDESRWEPRYANRHEGCGAVKRSRARRATAVANSSAVHHAACNKRPRSRARSTQQRDSRKREQAETGGFGDGDVDGEAVDAEVPGVDECARSQAEAIDGLVAPGVGGRTEVSAGVVEGHNKLRREATEDAHCGA